MRRRLVDLLNLRLFVSQRNDSTNKLKTRKTYGVPSPDVLKPIFVYESHPGGTHNYGDAKVAKEQYGAVDGFCVGKHGNSYAIPTEPVIGHCKSDHRLGRNFYKGLFGDSVNVMLAALAFNFKRVMNILLCPILTALSWLFPDWNGRREPRFLSLRLLVETPEWCHKPF